MLMGDPISAALGVGGIASNIVTNALNASASDRSYAFAKQQYQDMKLYNSAPEQVKRLRAAGLNPALVFGGDAGQVSAVSPAAPIPQQPLDLSGIASLSDSMALNDSQQEKNLSEVRINKLRSFGLELENSLNQKFAGFERDENLKLLKHKVTNAFNEGLLLAAQGDYTKAQEKLAKAEEFLSYAQGGKYHQEMKNLEEEFQWISAKANAYIDNLRHQNSALDAGAWLSGSSARLNDIDYAVKSDPVVFQSLKDTAIATLDKLKADKKVSDAEYQHLSALAEKAQKESDSYYYFQIVDRLISLGVSVADVLALSKRLKAFQGLSDAANKNARTRSERLEHDKDLDNNTYEEINEFTFKNGRPHRTKGSTRGRRRR